ncbi:MAG TPA: tripartite tricarboxylate transporter substrate-binding protein [Alphaproteobacteria bacterium]
MNARRFVLAVLFGLVWSGAALAETYPARPVRVVVPFPPGGPSDVLARVITQKLTESFSQQFYVDNHGGAGGTIGAGLVSHSPADGYTLLFGSTTILAVSPTMYPNLPYDPAAAFAPIGLFASVPLSLVVNRELPVSSVPELIAYVRARPGKLFYGSAGNGTQVHFAGVLFKSRAGLDIEHVPYKGGGPAMAAMLTGEFQYMFDTPQSSLPYARDGRVKMLALTSLTRSPLLPEYPTIAETALPGFEVISWNGLVAPAGTPREMVTQVNRKLRDLTNSKDFVDVLANLGATPTYSTPEEMGALLKRELVTWSNVAKENGIKAE